jgi:hypothetical protein
MCARRIFDDCEMVGGIKRKRKGEESCWLILFERKRHVWSEHNEVKEVVANLKLGLTLTESG